MDLDQEWVKHLLVVKKVNTQEVVQEFHLGSKVDNLHYIEEFQNVDLTMLVLKLNTLQSI